MRGGFAGGGRTSSWRHAGGELRLPGQIRLSGRGRSHRSRARVAASRPGRSGLGLHAGRAFFVRSDSWLVSAVPDGLAPQRAVFVNLLEVALNCHLDVRVRLGSSSSSSSQGVLAAWCSVGAESWQAGVIVVQPMAGRRENGASMGRSRGHGAGRCARRNRQTEREPGRRGLYRGDRRAERASGGDHHSWTGGYRRCALILRDPKVCCSPLALSSTTGAFASSSSQGQPVGFGASAALVARAAQRRSSELGDRVFRFLSALRRLEVDGPDGGRTRQWRAPE